MDFSAFLAKYGELLLEGTRDTCVMVGASTLGAYLIGIPLGLLLVTLGPHGLRPNRVAGAVLGWVINMGRSIPFIVLLVFLIPTTRALVGTSLGVPGAIVPLVVSAAPFVARMVEQSLKEVDGELVEAARSMGASTWQILTKVYLRECLPSLLRGLPICLITLLGYSAMAGTVGAGGLGDIAIRYGYQRYQDDVMFATILIMVVLVQLVQTGGDILARRVDRRMRG